MHVKGTLNHPSVCGNKWQLPWERILAASSPLLEIAQNNMYLSCSWLLMAAVLVTLAYVYVMHHFFSFFYINVVVFRSNGHAS